MMLMICKAIRWGAMFDEYDIFSPPSFDVQICYDDCLPPIYDDYCDDTYEIKNNDNHGTCHHDFNSQYDYANQVSHDTYFVEFAPTIMNEKEFAYVESSKFLCLCIMKRMLYVMFILLNSFMMLLKIIMREELMLLHIAIISSFLSMC